MSDDLGAARVAELLGDLAQLVLDDLTSDAARCARMSRRSAIVARTSASSDSSFSISRPVSRAEPHVEDRLGLPLRQREPLLQTRARRFRVGRRLDQLDDRVDVVDRDLAGLPGCASRSSACFSSYSVRRTTTTWRCVEEVPDHLLQVHDLRHAIHQRAA